MSPQVAVVIPVFNRADVITEAVESVLMQDGIDVEIIVVDDGSTDAIGEVLVDLARLPQVTTLRQDNAGPSAARNAGVAAARASLVTFLDSDDLMTPGRLRKQYDAWQAALPDRVVVIGHEEVDIAEGVGVPPHVQGRLDTNETKYPTSAFLHRDEFEAIGGYDEAMRLAEDVDLLMRLEDVGCTTVVLDDVVLTRRIRGDNLIYDPEVNSSIFLLIRRRIQRRREALGE